MIRHAIPYTQPSPACPCPLQPCGGLIPTPDCPDHGHRRNPAMEWHPLDHCPAGIRGILRRAADAIDALPPDLRGDPDHAEFVAEFLRIAADNTTA